VVLFVNKKNQKNFINLGVSALENPGSQGAKVFCALFFKKALLHLP